MEIYEIANKILRKYDFCKIRKLSDNDSFIDLGKLKIEIMRGDVWSCYRIAILSKVKLSTEWTLCMTMEEDRDSRDIMNSIYEAIDYMQEVLLSKEL